jgi:hypothetical protein
MSANGRKAIAAAQRKRWREQKQAERRVRKVRSGRSSWSGMTKAERSLEMKRRWQVRLQKQGKVSVGKLAARVRSGDAPKKMPRGFWQKEMAKLLAHGPRSRQEVLQILTRRYPAKRANLFVTFASMKKVGQLRESAAGMFSLPAVVPQEGANGSVQTVA